MSATVVVSPGGFVTLDPNDQRLFTFDWDTLNLEPGVTIATSTFTITTLRQSGPTALTKDNEIILVGGRSSQVRLLATTATLGDRYEVANKIVTNEIPSEQKERSFKVSIENK